jgi:hypothetical protein
MRKQNKSQQIWRVGGWVGFVIKSTTKGTCRLLNASCLGRSSLRRASYHAYLPRAPRLRAVGGHGLHRRRRARRDRSHLRCGSSRCVRRPRAIRCLVTPNSRQIEGPPARSQPPRVPPGGCPTGRVHSLLSRDPLGGGLCDESSFCRGARTGDAFPRGRALVFSRCPNGKNAAA